MWIYKQSIKHESIIKCVLHFAKSWLFHTSPLLLCHSFKHAWHSLKQLPKEPPEGLFELYWRSSYVHCALVGFWKQVGMPSVVLGVGEAKNRPCTITTAPNQTKLWGNGKCKSKHKKYILIYILFCSSGLQHIPKKLGMVKHLPFCYVSLLSHDT